MIALVVPTATACFVPADVRSDSISNQAGWEAEPPAREPVRDTPLDQLLAQRGRFLAFVRRRVPDSGLAEDILQSAYVRALEHQDDFQKDEPAVAWFYRLLRNAVIDTYRRGASRDRALERWTRELEGAVQAPPELAPDVCACLHGVVDALKPEYAEILRAVDLGEQRVQEFAEQQGISASNAGVRIHRARAALRRELLKTCSVCAEHGCLDCACGRQGKS